MRLSACGRALGCQLRTSMHAELKSQGSFAEKGQLLDICLQFTTEFKSASSLFQKFRASCGWSRRWPRSVFRQVFVDRGHSNRPSHCCKSLFKSDVGAKSFSQLATQTAFGVSGSVSFGAAQSSEKSTASKSIGVLPQEVRLIQ